VILVYGCDKELAQWASMQIFNNTDTWDDTVRAIGVKKNNHLIAAVVYSMYIPNVLIEMSVASVDKSWATRHNLKAFFKYPFIQLGLERVQTHCSATARDIIMFNKRLGFKPEGLHRKAWLSGGDAISFGMLKTECRWL
jgi:hypothetical protein